MAKRTIKVFGYYDSDGDWVRPDREEVREVLLDLEGALFQLGGSVTIATARQVEESGEGRTLGYLVTHDTFAPAIKPTVGEPDEEPAADAAEPE